jgi:hypothetical protein
MRYSGSTTASNQYPRKGQSMNEDEDDYEYIFDIFYTLFGFVIFVFVVIGIVAIVAGLISLL